MKKKTHNSINRSSKKFKLTALAFVISSVVMSMNIYAVEAEIAPKTASQNKINVAENGKITGGGLDGQTYINKQVLYGGKGLHEDVTKNEVSFEDASGFTNINVIGAKSIQAASENKISITKSAVGTEVLMNITGAQADGDATDNHITLTEMSKIVGGAMAVSEVGGKATKNTVSIAGRESGGLEIVDGSVMAAQAGGDTTDNHLTLTNVSKISGSVMGALSANDEVTANTVSIDGLATTGAEISVREQLAAAQSGGGNAKNNILTMTNVSKISGQGDKSAVMAAVAPNGVAEGNKLSVTGIDAGAEITTNIMGVYAAGDATKNSVQLTNVSKLSVQGDKSGVMAATAGGTAEENSLSITGIDTGAEINATIMAVQTAGAATKNSVQLANVSKLSGSITGAMSANDKATDNTVSIDGIATGAEISVRKQLVAAMSLGGNAKNNTVTMTNVSKISGEGDTDAIIAAVAPNGVAEGNKLSVTGIDTGAEIITNIMAAQTAGAATKNSVQLANVSKLSGQVLGAITEDAEVTENTITIAGVAKGAEIEVVKELLAGQTTGAARKNGITLTNVSKINAKDEANIVAAVAGSDLEENYVNITGVDAGAEIAANIKVGQTLGDATNNTLSIANASKINGSIMSASANSASENKVIIVGKDKEHRTKISGFISTVDTKKDAISNETFLKNVELGKGVQVYTGLSKSKNQEDSRKSNKNKLVLWNVSGEEGVRAYAGTISHEKKGEAKENEVFLVGDTNLQNISVYGGVYKSEIGSPSVAAEKGDFTGNILHIGLKDDDGMHAWISSNENGNVLKEGSIKSFQNIKFNVVEWNPNKAALVIKEEADLSNMLVDAKGMVFKNLEELQKFFETNTKGEMYLIDANSKGEKALQEGNVSIDEKYTIGTTLEGTATATVVKEGEHEGDLLYSLVTKEEGGSEIIKPDPDAGEGGSEIIKPDPDEGEGGSEIIKPDPDEGEGGSEIIKPDSDEGEGGSEIIKPDPDEGEGGSEIIKPDPDEGKGGSEIIKPDPDEDNSDIVKSFKLVAQEQTHNVVIGQTSAFAAVSGGQSFVDQALTNSVSSFGPITAFGTSAGSDKYETGSHIKTKIFNANLAVGYSMPVSSSKLAYIGFFEYGHGSYDTESRGVKGNGDIDYKGIAVATKYLHNSGFYTEGSLRYGRAKNTANNVLTDAKGNAYSYETSGNYVGGSLGLGQIFNITDNANLDVYTKYTYMHLDKDDFHTGLIGRDHYKLNAVNSHIGTLGFRMNHNVNDWTLYYGLAAEHQFDGASTGTADGIAIRATDVKGTTVMFELGTKLHFSAQSNWALDFGIKGYTGKHQGVRGNFGLSYKF